MPVLLVEIRARKLAPTTPMVIVSVQLLTDDAETEVLDGKVTLSEPVASFLSVA